MDKTSFKGVLAPVITPFGPDLSPDGKRLAVHCRWLLAQGLSGLAVFGTTSEANSLGMDERMALLDGLLADGIAPARLMPGTGCCALTDTVRLTRQAVSAGCGGVLMLPPFYYKGVSDEGVFRSYAEVIERVGDARLKIYLYHIPPQSQVPIGIALIERLRRAYPDAIAGIKDSSGDEANLRALLSAFAGTDFDVYAGSEALLLANLEGGGAGCITATANLSPAAIAALARDWRLPGARDAQARLDLVRTTLQSQPLIPALKAMIAHGARDEAWSRVRPPLVELDDDARKQLAGELERIGFDMSPLAALRMT